MSSDLFKNLFNFFYPLFKHFLIYLLIQRHLKGIIMTQRATITISTRKEIRDQFAEYAESQGLSFSTWAMLELKKVVDKGQKV